jgi:ribosomal protein S12 methylthiotransferase accessory factor
LANKRPHIAIVGDADLVGVLGAGLDRLVRNEASIERPGKAGDVDLLVVLNQHRSMDDRWNHIAASSRSGQVTLPCYFSASEVVIGPLLPSSPENGCPACLDKNRLAGLTANETEYEIKSVYGARLLPVCQRLVHVVLAKHIKAHLSGAPSSLIGQSCWVDCHTLDVSMRRVVPVEGCPWCQPVANVPPKLEPTFDLRIKPHPSSYRLVSLEQVHQRIARVVDRRIGPIRELGTSRGKVAMFGRARTQYAQDDRRTSGWSVGWESSDCKTVAVAEALERRAGAYPIGRHVVQARWPDVRDQALHPASFGLPSMAQYRRPGYLFTPFADERQHAWVWAYSFGRRAPVLVLQELAFYLPNSVGPRVLAETSNGQAVGADFVEATLYGLLEAVERDAVLMVWHSRLPTPRLDVERSCGGDICLLIELINSRLGYEVHTCNATMEHGIPTIICIAVARKPTPDKPVTMMAACAHLDPLLAVKGALSELVMNIESHDLVWYRSRLPASRRMLNNPSLVRTIQDHALVNALPEAAGRFSPFLSGELLPFHEIFREALERVVNPDLTSDLLRTIEALAAHQLDVVAVDLTTRELKSLGLTAVKVLVPGLIPLTFGAHNERLTGLPRLFTVPRQLGFDGGPLRYEGLYTQPHPFP